MWKNTKHKQSCQDNTSLATDLDKLRRELRENTQAILENIRATFILARTIRALSNRNADHIIFGNVVIEDK